MWGATTESEFSMVTIDDITTVSESNQNRADVSVFDFKSNAVHVILDGNGDPWFLAKDVCNVLGTHTKDIRAILDEDEVRKIPNVDSIDIGGISTKNGGKAPLIVSEPGLYNLIAHSRKPEAKPFQRWVTHEVLPAIRKTGGYNTTATLGQLVDNPDMVIALAMKVKEERAARELAETALHDFTSPAGSYDLKTAAKILNRTDSIKTGANRLAKWLVANNWCYRQKDGKHDLLTPYQKTVEAGWLEVRAYKPFTDAKGNTHRSVQVRITGRGLNRIRLLMLAGVQPDVQSMVGGVAVDLFAEIED